MKYLPLHEIALFCLILNVFGGLAAAACTCGSCQYCVSGHEICSATCWRTCTDPETGEDYYCKPYCCERTFCCEVCRNYCAGTDSSCGCTSCSDCTAQNGWYNNGAPYACCVGESRCTCQYQDYRNYHCSSTSCTFESWLHRTIRYDCYDCNNNNHYLCYGNDLYFRDYFCSGGACSYTDSFVRDCCGGEAYASDGDGGNNPSVTAGCSGGIGAGCSGSSCYTTPGASGTDHCEGTCHTGINGCYFREYFIADSSDGCSGPDTCTSTTHDADTNPNTCNTCRIQRDSTLRWNLGCSGGTSCASSPNTCCGDDSAEYNSTCQCNPVSCACGGDQEACCRTSDSCVWSGGCYLHDHQADIDIDGSIEYCYHGTWFAFPDLNSSETNLSTNISIVDRDKESADTHDKILITIRVYDQDDWDASHIYLTIQNPSGGIEINPQELFGGYVDSKHWIANYTYDPRNDAPLGKYDVTIKAVDLRGYSAQKTFEDAFTVEDLNIATTWSGNTTDIYFTGNAKEIFANLGISEIISQNCSEPSIVDIPDGNNDTRKDYVSLRLCGVNNLTAGTCTVSAGAFTCYVQDIKITNKSPSLSYVLTDPNHISGSQDIYVRLNGTINGFGITDPDKYVNPWQNLTYLVDCQNTENVGWWGEFFNQTKTKIHSPSSLNPTGETHISVDYSERQAYVNLRAPGRTQFSYNSLASFVLGKYEYIADLRYFWPEYLGGYGFTPFNYQIANRSTNYTIAAIDITHHTLPKRVIRGELIEGVVGGYFIASMDIDYWEVVQAAKYRCTNKTTEGRYWVTSHNVTSGNDTVEIPE
ncbi:MAG: hypothetical protein JW727_00815, partial [Candidatus Aenigmarchaeota archaeon]|nr:hypothetical protein [Candidatus Aenigmarchaeota archaeon]